MTNEIHKKNILKDAYAKTLKIHQILVEKILVLLFSGEVIFFTNIDKLGNHFSDNEFLSLSFGLFKNTVFHNS